MNNWSNFSCTTVYLLINLLQSLKPPEKSRLFCPFSLFRHRLQIHWNSSNQRNFTRELKLSRKKSNSLSLQKLFVPLLKISNDPLPCKVRLKKMPKKGLLPNNSLIRIHVYIKCLYVKNIFTFHLLTSLIGIKIPAQIISFLGEINNYFACFFFLLIIFIHIKEIFIRSRNCL